MYKHMKKLLMLFALVIGLMSCGSGENTASAKSPEKDRVEVIYFHGKQRCATCISSIFGCKITVTALQTICKKGDCHIRQPPLIVW